MTMTLSSHEAADRLRQYLREFDMAYTGPLELIDLLERAAGSGITPELRLTVEADGSISRIAGGPLEEPLATGGNPSEGKNEAANRLRDWMYDPILDDAEKARAFALLDVALATERRHSVKEVECPSCDDSWAAHVAGMHEEPA